MISERLVKLLLERAFGKLLKGRLDLSNIQVQIAQATVSLKKIWLDEVILTALLRDFGIPVIVESVFLGGFSLQIPWNDIVEENSSFEVQEVFISATYEKIEFQAPVVPEVKDWSSTLASSILFEEGFTHDDQEPFPMENEKIEARLIKKIFFRMQISIHEFNFQWQHAKETYYLTVDSLEYKDTKDNLGTGTLNKELVFQNLVVRAGTHCDTSNESKLDAAELSRLWEANMKRTVFSSTKASEEHIFFDLSFKPNTFGGEEEKEISSVSVRFESPYIYEMTLQPSDLQNLHAVFTSGSTRTKETEQSQIRFSLQSSLKSVNIRAPGDLQLSLGFSAIVDGETDIRISPLSLKLKDKPVILFEKVTTSNIKEISGKIDQSGTELQFATGPVNFTYYPELPEVLSLYSEYLQGSSIPSGDRISSSQIPTTYSRISLGFDISCVRFHLPHQSTSLTLELAKTSLQCSHYSDDPNLVLEFYVQNLSVFLNDNGSSQSLMEAQFRSSTGESIPIQFVARPEAQEVEPVEPAPSSGSLGSGYSNTMYSPTRIPESRFVSFRQTAFTRARYSVSLVIQWAKLNISNSQLSLLKRLLSALMPPSDTPKEVIKSKTPLFVLLADIYDGELEFNVSSDCRYFLNFTNCNNFAQIFPPEPFYINCSIATITLKNEHELLVTPAPHQHDSMFRLVYGPRLDGGIDVSISSVVLQHHQGLNWATELASVFSSPKDAASTPEDKSGYVLLRIDDVAIEYTPPAQFQSKAVILAQSIICHLKETPLIYLKDLALLLIDDAACIAPRPPTATTTRKFYEDTNFVAILDLPFLEVQSTEGSLMLTSNNGESVSEVQLAACRDSFNVALSLFINYFGLDIMVAAPTEPTWETVSDIRLEMEKVFRQLEANEKGAESESEDTTESLDEERLAPRPASPVPVLEEYVESFPSGGARVINRGTKDIQIIEDYDANRRPKPRMTAEEERLLNESTLVVLELEEEASSEEQTSDVEFPEPKEQSRISIFLDIRFSMCDGYDLTGQSRRHSKSHVALHAAGLSVSILTFPPGVYQSRTLIDVDTLEIEDHMPGTLNRLLTYNTDVRRSPGTPMISACLDIVKPSPQASEEQRFALRLLPLRLNIDQDTASFLFDYFMHSAISTGEPIPNQLLPFFQSVKVDKVDIKIDYKPKRLDVGSLGRGHVIELLNVIPGLEGARIPLPAVQVRGVYGWGAVLDNLAREWLKGFLTTGQILDFLSSGVGAISPIVKDLVLIPMQAYQNDDDVLRAAARSTTNLAKTVATETLNVISKVMIGTQYLMEGADRMLTVREFLIQQGSPNTSGRSHYAAQPATAAEGLHQAYQSVKRELRMTKRVIVVPLTRLENGDLGAVGSLAKAIPVAVLRPVIGLTEGAAKAALGMRNYLAPNLKQDADNKWKS